MSVPTGAANGARHYLAATPYCCALQLNLAVNGTTGAITAAALTAIAAQLYTPDASLVVTPIGAFSTPLVVRQGCILGDRG
jgi:hypothetical protein